MTTFNRLQFARARRGHRALSQVVYPQVVAMRADPEKMVRDIEGMSTPQDREELSDPEHRKQLIEGMAEAVERSLDGWLADNMAMTRPWRFDPAWIGVPTLIWHSGGDVFAPVAHARWLAGRIPGAELVVVERAAHLSAAAAQVHAITWAARGAVRALAG